MGVALGASGSILVIDAGAGTDCPVDPFGCGALFSVTPSTGIRTLLSDFGNATQGPTGAQPDGVALGTNGNILVIDSAAGTHRKGALFSVAPNTGMRTLLSDFGNAAQGPTGAASVVGVAVGASGNVLVIDRRAGTGGKGALFSVAPSTGVRTLLSDFGNAAQGPTGVAPYGVTELPVNSSELIDKTH